MCVCACVCVRVCGLHVVCLSEICLRKPLLNLPHRLCLPGDLVEDGRETASYDIDRGKYLLYEPPNHTCLQSFIFSPQPLLLFVLLKRTKDNGSTGLTC